jgi:hypothetical protein
MINLENGGRGGIHFTSTNSDTSPAGVANLEPHGAVDANGESGAVANPVADIPTEPKAFQAWCYDNGSRGRWPSDLWHLAARAYQSMLMSERDPEAWRHSPGTRRLNLKDWSAFTTAYAAYRETPQSFVEAKAERDSGWPDAEHKAREVV